MHDEASGPLDRPHVRRSFERAAATYDAAAALQREVGDRLLERLDYVKLQPARVLDLGSGTGHCAQALLKRYPRARVAAVDLAWSMARRTRDRHHWWRRPLAACADARALPFADGGFDLVVSNLMLQWCVPLEPYFAEVRRVLGRGGLFLFTSFGTDTLKELRAAWARVDARPHVHGFLDMHDVGDALLAAGFGDPVMDMEVLTVTYRELLDLMRDLKSIGAHNASPSRAPGLTGRQTLKALTSAYESFRDAEGRLPTTYEVVYGHGWAPAAPAPSPKPERWVPLRPVK